MTLVLASVLGLNRMRGWQVVGLAVAFAGVAVVVFARDGGEPLARERGGSAAVSPLAVVIGAVALGGR